MQSTVVWIFTCGHRLIKGTVGQSKSSKKLSCDKCPECTEADHKEKAEKKKLLEQNEAHFAGLKQHIEFLATQVEKTTEDAALKEAFEKVLEATFLLLAEKSRKILLAKDEEFREKSPWEKLRMLAAAKEHWMVLENVAKIRFERDEISRTNKSDLSLRTADIWAGWEMSIRHSKYVVGAKKWAMNAVEKAEEQMDKDWKQALKLTEDHR